jgi:hypothetical protein
MHIIITFCLNTWIRLTGHLIVSRAIKNIRLVKVGKRDYSSVLQLSFKYLTQFFHIQGDFSNKKIYSIHQDDVLALYMVKVMLRGQRYKMGLFLCLNGL